METGHLDRVAHGVIGKDIVSACDCGSDGGEFSSAPDKDMAKDINNSLAEPGEISISQVSSGLGLKLS